MAESRTKNAKRNGAWGIISRIVGLLLPFLSRTVIIKALGAEYLGLNGLFTSILTVLNLTELGVGSAIVYSMYKPIATGDDELVCALLNLYKKIYKIIGVSIIVIGVILMPFISNLVSGDVPLDINIYILFGLYIINTVVSYFLFAYKQSLIHACQRDDVTSKITIVTSILLNISQIILLFLTRNYYWFIILQIVSVLISNLINSYCADKLFPQYKCHGEISKELGHDIKQRVTGLMIIKVAAVSRNALDSIIVSTFLGLQAVAMYNNYYYIINAVSSILLVLMSAIAAGVGNSVAVESKEKNLEDMRNINFLYMMISGLCTSCIITMYQPFMRIWVGENLMFSETIMILFSLYFILQKIGDVQAQYFDAAGLWWYGKWRGFIEALFNLILNIGLGYFFGVTGIVIATIFTIIFINFPLTTYYTFKYYYGKKMMPFIVEQLFMVSKIIICSAACYFVANLMPNGSGILIEIVFMGLKGISAILIFTGLFSILNIRNQRFKTSLKWIKARIKVKDRGRLMEK